MKVQLYWRTVDYPRDRFFVKGTVLAQAIVPGTLSRFAIREVRGGRDQHGYPTLRYGLADAETVTLDDVRNGKDASVVFWGDDPDDCLKYLSGLAQ